MKGATAPNATNFNCDFGFEREEGIDFDAGVPLVTTSGIVLNFCEKESEGLKYGAPSPAPATQQESDIIMFYLQHIYIGEFEAPRGAFDTTNIGDAIGVLGHYLTGIEIDTPIAVFNE